MNSNPMVFVPLSDVLITITKLVDWPFGSTCTYFLLLVTTWFSLFLAFSLVVIKPKSEKSKKVQKRQKK